MTCARRGYYLSGEWRKLLPKPAFANDAMPPLLLSSWLYNRADRPPEDSMGAWGSGSFENDDAADWVAQLGTIGLEDLVKIFSTAADYTGYFEAPAASIVVAAAEVVAALNGCRLKETPPEIVKWTTNRQAPAPELKALALRALDRVRKDSELKDLWLEADGLNDWTAAIQDLQTRVGS